MQRSFYWYEESYAMRSLQHFFLVAVFEPTRFDFRGWWNVGGVANLLLLLDSNPGLLFLRRKRFPLHKFAKFSTYTSCYYAVGHVHKRVATLSRRKFSLGTLNLCTMMQILNTLLSTGPAFVGSTQSSVSRNIPKYEILYLGMKFCTWVWNFIPGYEILYLGMQFWTWVWKNFRYMSWVWNVIFRCTISSPGRKYHTQVRKLKPMWTETDLCGTICHMTYFGFFHIDWNIYWWTTPWKHFAQSNIHSFMVKILWLNWNLWYL
jgi:hypothetical protein